MSKIRVLSDHIANQIAAGEVVERPSSVAKELVENAIDAGARRIEIDVEAGGRRLLRVSDDGEGMSRDDAVLAFERHATSKISRTEDLQRISTLGFRGEALASIASVARVELLTQGEGIDAATRVLIEGGRMRDVGVAARTRGTTITVRELFFNVPARRKFLRSEATESFHLMNLVTHYALAHPEIAFLLNNNGRETLRAAPASSLRERAYQIFGAEFLESLLEVAGGDERLVRVSGYVSAPRERRTTRDAQYLFVNGRYVRDRLISRALSEGFRTILPQGVFPAALLFLEVPPEEVDVNVHPSKTEVRFRRAVAVSDVVRDTVRAALASGGYVRDAAHARAQDETESDALAVSSHARDAEGAEGAEGTEGAAFETTRSETASGVQYSPAARDAAREKGFGRALSPEQRAIEFGFASSPTGDVRRLEDKESEAGATRNESSEADSETGEARSDADETGAMQRHATETTQDASTRFATSDADFDRIGASLDAESSQRRTSADATPHVEARQASAGAERSFASLPPLDSVAGMLREVAAETLSTDIRPLGQFGESYIVAADSEGLLLFDQRAAHERILFDKYH
ncbi:MAG TPA: DNA mismatch repair endonuclease MutL, partial [Pyrinomonadaceae bacterium]|nr:DNA mismatch repair endonuclease MutL [Pyrinomonadaceae bacterium]